MTRRDGDAVPYGKPLRTFWRQESLAVVLLLVGLAQVVALQFGESLRQSAPRASSSLSPRSSIVGHGTLSPLPIVPAADAEERAPIVHSHSG